MGSLRHAAAALAVVVLGCGGSEDNGAGSGGSAGGGTGGAAGAGGTAGSGGMPAPLEQGDPLVLNTRYTRNGNPGPDFVEILDVEIAGNIVYLCTSTQGLLVVDRTLPDLPIIGQETLPGTAAGGRCQHVVIDGTRLVLAHRGDEIWDTSYYRTYDVSDPRIPMQLDHVDTDGPSFEGLAVLGGDRYAVAMHSDGLAILDWDGAGLRRVGQVGGLVNAWEAEPVGDRLYVSDDTGGVVVVDATNPAAPTIVGQIALPGSVKHVEPGDGVLFASAGSEGVHVLDLADPDAPTLLTTIDTTGSAVVSALARGHLFVGDWNDVRIYDVTDPAAPRLLGGESPPVADAFPRVLAIDAIDDRVYVGEWSGLYDYTFVPGVAAPDIRANNFAIQYPPTGPGEVSAASLIITNDGPFPLEITSIEASGAFNALGSTLTIDPGENDFVEVRFESQTTSTARGTLTLVSNDPDESNLLVDLAGNVPGIGVGDSILGQGWSWVDVQTGTQMFTPESMQGNVVLLSYFATF